MIVKSKCSFCGTSFNHKKNAIKEKECYTNQNNPYILRYVICPHCSRTIIVEDK